MVSVVEIMKVAKSARLVLSDDEANKFASDCSGILDAFAKINEIQTKDIEPTFQPIEIKNILREDIVLPSLPLEQALSLTNLKKDGYFKGPRII